VLLRWPEEKTDAVISGRGTRQRFSAQVCTPVGCARLPRRPNDGQPGSSARGGVAYETSTTSASRDARAANATAKAGVAVPVISSLLRLEVGGELLANLSGESSEQVQIQRQHTSSSLFNLLRARLESMSLVTEVADA